MPLNRPSFKGVYKLRCPYCLETRFPLAFWSRWPERCLGCNYAIEREPGYFSAVPWVLTYTPTFIMALLLWLLLKHSPLSYTVKLSLILILSIVIAFGSLPFAKVFWLYLDHRLHPLEKDNI